MSPAWHIYRGLPPQMNNQNIPVDSHQAEAKSVQSACLDHDRQRDEESRTLGVSDHIFLRPSFALHSFIENISIFTARLGILLSLNMLTVGHFVAV